jgi:hypothetical protein
MYPVLTVRELVTGLSFATSVDLFPLSSIPLSTLSSRTSRTDKPTYLLDN